MGHYNGDPTMQGGGDTILNNLAARVALGATILTLAVPGLAQASAKTYGACGYGANNAPGQTGLFPGAETPNGAFQHKPLGDGEGAIACEQRQQDVRP